MDLPITKTMETSEAHVEVGWFSGSIPEFVQTGRALEPWVKNGSLLQVIYTRGGGKFAAWSLLNRKRSLRSRERFIVDPDPA